MDNAYRCEEVIPFCEDEAKRGLQDISFYLERLEEFIVVERDREINELKKYEHNWNTEKLGDFWGWHYPVHWDEIFVKQLRSCFVISLLSFVESNILLVVSHVCEVAQVKFREKALHGNFFDNLRNLLVDKCKFASPSQDTWDEIGKIQMIRNRLVHHGARIYNAGESKEADSRSTLIGLLPGLSEEHGVLEIGCEFPLHASRVVKTFLQEFYGEAEALCKRYSNG